MQILLCKELFLGQAALLGAGLAVQEQQQGADDTGGNSIGDGGGDALDEDKLNGNGFLKELMNTANHLQKRVL